jgi:hypothetical protein
MGLRHSVGSSRFSASRSEQRALEEIQSGLGGSKIALDLRLLLIVVRGLDGRFGGGLGPLWRRSSFPV